MIMLIFVIALFRGEILVTVSDHSCRVIVLSIIHVHVLPSCLPLMFNFYSCADVLDSSSQVQ